MVSRQTRQAGNEVLDVLSRRDVQGVAAIGLSTAGGVVVAQEITDFILPQLGMSKNPSSAAGLGASALVKGGVALGFGAVATRLSGIGTLITAFMGVGSLTSAGADVIDMLQSGGLPGAAPAQRTPTGQQPRASGGAGGGSGNAQRRAPTNGFR